MTPSGQKRKRQRVTGLDLRPSSVAQALLRLREHGVLLRLGLCLLAVLLLWGVTRPWHPPFPYRSGMIPHRDIVSSVSFSIPNEIATREAQKRAAERVLHIYTHDPEALVNLREELNLAVGRVLASESPGEAWDDFVPPDMPADQRQMQFESFKSALSTEEARKKLKGSVAAALQLNETSGLLKEPPPSKDPSTRLEISVYQEGQPDVLQTVKVADVLIGDGEKIHQRLSDQVEFVAVADRVFTWLQNRLRPTLKPDEARTRAAQQAAAQKVPEIPDNFTVGQVLVKAGQPIEAPEMNVLLHEHLAAMARISATHELVRSLASLMMILALFVMCGYYVYFHEPLLSDSVQRLSVMLVLAVATVQFSSWLSIDQWRAEVIPLLLFAMTVTISYRQELSLLLSVALCLVIVFALGLGLGHFIMMMGTSACAIFMLGRIRSRMKLITVGFCAGILAFALSVGIGVLEGEPIGDWSQTQRLITEGGRYGAWTLVAAFIISGALPFIESRFGVVTDISLLELGDVSHPLLQELVRRAPGTYNHSINVASIGDAAAEAIGANGLLVRVGAYFHDIGKMLKPGYFIENQGPEGNRHESLVPAMSALIIIAHVKDGADLARQHNLPQPIIDFIEQHHGTTLVEYFYHRAKDKEKEEGLATTIMESDYRYPGPKPQSKEAAVMMVADAVESASRVLEEPTPTRIRNLVHSIAMKRLLDGQFDECGLNLRELKIVEDSLVKSLTAVYHSRVKYPEQKSA